jgi:hypothetical protein
LWIKSDGNIGIGTTSPAEKLHVAGDIRLNSGGDIAFADDNTRIYESSNYLYITADEDIYLRPDDDIFIQKDGGTTWVRFDNDSQELGIGTTSPAARVHITNNTSNEVLYVTNTTSAEVYRMINFERTQDLSSNNDILQIKTTSGSNTGAQFIECERGTDVEFKVNVNGTVNADGAYTTPASDFAEMINVSSGAYTAEPGDVMVIDLHNPRSILKAFESRSTLVAGIYSTNPGFIGAGREWDKPSTGKGESETYTLKEIASEFNEIPLAVVGIVPCKVSAENGAINPGDLLVTSSIPGHAMRDENPKVGTVVGKALGSLSSDTGVIQVLVMLQ